MRSLNPATRRTKAQLAMIRANYIELFECADFALLVLRKVHQHEPAKVELLRDEFITAMRGCLGDLCTEDEMQCMEGLLLNYQVQNRRALASLTRLIGIEPVQSLVACLHNCTMDTVTEPTMDLLNEIMSKLERQGQQAES